MDSSGDIDPHGGRAILQTSGQKDKVFHGSAVGIRVLTRIHHIACDSEGTLRLHILPVGHQDDVIVLQGHVRHAPVHDSTDSNSYDLKREIFLLPDNLCPACEGILVQASCLFDKFPDGSHPVPEAVGAWSSDRAFDFQTVGEPFHLRVYAHDVTVAESEVRGGIHLHRIYFLPVRTSAGDPHVGLVSLGSEASGIFDQPVKGLPRSHLVPHGALHIALDSHEIAVRRDIDHIPVMQSDVTGSVAVDKIAVDVDCSQLFSVPGNPHFAQASKVGDSTGPVQSSEDCRE